MLYKLALIGLACIGLSTTVTQATDQDQCITATKFEQRSINNPLSEEPDSRIETTYVPQPRKSISAQIFKHESTPSYSLFGEYVPVEQSKFSLDSQEHLCSGTELAILHAKNMISSQNGKNQNLKKAIKNCDYCTTKFLLDHGACKEQIFQGFNDQNVFVSFNEKDGTLKITYEIKVDFLSKLDDRTPKNSYNTPQAVGQMLYALKPYGVKRISVEQYGNFKCFWSTVTVYE